MLTTTSQLLDHASTTSTPVLAFNAITLEHAAAIVDGSADAGTPVIIQVSQNAIRYHGGRAAPLLAACAKLAQHSGTAVALHLDHIDDLELFHQSADLGASSAMIDASRLPDEENIRVTANAAEWAHARGLLVEAELGAIGGKRGDAHSPGVRTDPAQARQFVADTGVDALAVAVGSSHAMTSRNAELDLELIGRLANAVAVPLVLHGSSGVPTATLRDAAAAGIVKINVGTLLNAAFTGALRSSLDITAVDPRGYLAPAREAVRSMVYELQRHVATPCSPEIPEP